MSLSNLNGRGSILVEPGYDWLLRDYHWYVDERGEIRRSFRVDGKPSIELLHRRLWLEAGRDLPEGLEIDHVDGNPMNNLLKNLRLATRQQNSQNRKKHQNNSSGYKGVSFCRANGQWLAMISVNKKRIYLGYHPSPESASEAYQTAAKEHFGEFKRPHQNE